MPRPPARRGRPRRQPVAKAPKEIPKPAGREYGGNSVEVVIAAPRTVERHAKPSNRASAQEGGDSPIIEDENSKTAKHQTPTAKTRHIIDELPVPLSSPRRNDFPSSFHNRGDTSSKIRKIGTPAFESSMLSNFRRRPRQPSILQMMQGDPSSELDEDDDNFLGSFDPDDESTPLKIANRQSIPRDPMLTPSASMLYKSPTGSVKKRRLQIGGQVQVPRSPGQITIASTNEERAEYSASEDDFLPTPRRAQLSPAPEIWSQTMMPPISSPASTLPIQQLDSQSDQLHDTSRVHPNAVGNDVEPRISTAALRENLLPQRQLRQRRQRGNRRAKILTDYDDDGLYNIHFGHAGVDEDELSYLPSKIRKPKGSRGAKNKIDSSKASVSTRGAQGQKAKRQPMIRSSNIQRTRTSDLSRSKKVSDITYSSHRRHAKHPDKENQPTRVRSLHPSEPEEPDSADEALTPAPNQSLFSEELRRQAEKFAEISRWSMEFEDVTTSMD
ncbi:hypothetical protein FQN55_002354 [Onygenales sp. PD_40]|nr:hypothetical protein FQN55_002354 [Onygenales sp. PD_40]KAK2782478.1 hypothetical protein FQN52_000911 [Onygenales sp. PD_12]KAK2783336.1 hypothetical protein FQN53_009227 [Emmonsiellopsis sp. PD_33]